jgi:hypothetical protein
MDLCEYAEPALRDLLAADCVLPEQFWETKDGGHLSGERALMWAVLADGIDCYRRNAHATSLQQRSEFHNAERWVLSTDWDWPFSFVNLCELFGFDPKGVRRALRRFKTKGTQTSFRRRRFRPVTLHAA